MKLFHWILITLFTILLTACGANLEVTKKKLLDSGNEYFDQGRFREAVIMYTRAVQQDRRYGEAYFQLAKAEMSLGRYVPGARALHRAVELQPENREAFTILCEIYLSALAADPGRKETFILELNGLLERAEKTDSDPFQILRVRGYVAMAEEEYDLAVGFMEKARAIDPGDRQLALGLVRALIANDRFDEAMVLGHAVITDHPDYGPMYDRLYAAYLEKGDAAAAEKLIEDKQAAKPDDLETNLQLAAHYHRLGDAASRDEILQTLEAATAEKPEWREALGEFYEAIKNNEAAIRMYRAALEAQPASKVLFQLHIAEALSASGRGSEALQVVEEILQADPDNPYATALRGALRLYGGDPDSATGAINDMASVIADMPNNPVLRYNLGMAYLALNDPDKALVQFQEASALLPSYQASRFQLGRLYLMKNQPAESARLADEILQVNPKSVRGRLLRGAASLELKEYNQTVAFLTSVLDEDSNNTDAQFLLASLNVAQRNYGEAEKLLRRLYETAPQDSRGIQGLISLYIAEGRPKEAQKMLDRELEKNPESRQLRLVSANIAMEASDYDRAIVDYGQVLEESPEEASVNIAIGMAYYYAGQFDKAETHLRQARRSQPKNPIANLRLSMLVGEMGRFDESRQILEDVLKSAPDHFAALNNMAYILAQSDETLDTALTLAQKAVSLVPMAHRATVSETLGWIYYKKGLSDQAISVYEDVVLLAPNNPKWRFRYAQALFQEGNRVQAKKELELALTHKPNRTERQQIEKLLSQINF